MRPIGDGAASRPTAMSAWLDAMIDPAGVDAKTISDRRECSTAKSHETVGHARRKADQSPPGRCCPPIARVGFSFNPYRWREHIDPKAGMVRLVLGLGTRASEWTDAVRVIEPAHLPGAAAGLVLHADTLKQEVLCYLERGEVGGEEGPGDKATGVKAAGDEG